MSYELTAMTPKDLPECVPKHTRFILFGKLLMLPTTRNPTPSETTALQKQALTQSRLEVFHLPITNGAEMNRNKRCPAPSESETCSFIPSCSAVRLPGFMSNSHSCMPDISFVFFYDVRRQPKAEESENQYSECKHGTQKPSSKHPIFIARP